MSAMPAAPATTNASVGVKSGSPVDFSIYDEDLHYVLYITDDPTEEHKLKVELNNTSNAVINFAALTGTEADPWHFELRFRKGTLSDKTLNILRGKDDKIKSLLSTDDQNNWAIGLDESSSGTKAYISLYVRSKGSAALNPGSSMILPLQHISADAGSGARGTRVEFVPHQMTLGGQSLPSREQHLFISNHSGQRQIPLHVGFVGSNRILNDGQVHNDLKLTLQIRNIAKPSQKHYETPTVILKAKSDKNAASEIIITSAELKPKIDQADMKVMRQVKDGAGWKVEQDSAATFSKRDWSAGEGGSQELTLTPEKDTALNPGDYIEIKLSGFQASPPSGLAHMYVNYHNIPGYWDGRFVLTVEKTPLLFGDTNNVGIGTTKPQIHLAIGDNDTGLHQQGDGNLAIYTNNAERVRIDSSGNVGIGTTSPTARLEVNGRTTLYGDVQLREWGTMNIAFLQARDDNSNRDIGLRLRTQKAGVAPANTPSIIDAFTINGSGNVGIGTTTPGFPLSFANTVGDKISLWGQSGDTIGFGVQNALLQIHTAISSNDIAFGYGSSANMTETMRIKGNGNVGIGTISPTVKLEVKGRIKDETGYVMPVGTILAYAGSAAPDGWLICNGTAIPQDDKYKTLRDLIGSNTPNLIGRTLIGAGSSYALRATGGAEKHTLTIAEMPSHSHSYTLFPESRGKTAGGEYWQAGNGKTGDTGGNQPHNNMQPYYVVNYIIKY
jgi:microcystin-dependent protein